MRTRHFGVELEEPAKMATIHRSQSLDCDARYFYEREVVERTPEGIESGATQLGGRPSSHQERETLFVNGKTYGRNTSRWENAPFGLDDAHPEWGPLSRARDPGEECQAMAKGESLGYVSYDVILKEGHIAYLGRQRINGHKCLEYGVTFLSQVLKETKVCLGASDDLPYRVMREDYTATYRYEPILRMPAPVSAAPPGTQ